MADDESVWREIGRVRELATSNEMRIAVLESQVRTLLDGVVASEGRVKSYIDESQKIPLQAIAEIIKRLDRTRNAILAAMPVIVGLVLALMK